MAKKKSKARQRPRMVFQWDAASDEDGNVAHIARHDVAMEEAETVVRNGKNFTRSDSSSSYPMSFGRTEAGRFLAVVWYAVGSDPQVVRVITAYDVDPPTRR